MCSLFTSFSAFSHSLPFISVIIYLGLVSNAVLSLSPSLLCTTFILSSALLLSNTLSSFLSPPIRLSTPSCQFLISFLALTRFFLHVSSTLNLAFFFLFHPLAFSFPFVVITLRFYVVAFKTNRPESLIFGAVRWCLCSFFFFNISDSTVLFQHAVSAE